MIGLYIQFLILLFFALYMLNSKSCKDVYIVLFLYLISSFTAIFIDINTVLPQLVNFTNLDNVEISIFFIYGVFIVYCLSPLYSVRNERFRPEVVSYTFGKIEKYFILFICFGALFSIVYTIPYSIKSILLGAKNIRVDVLNSDESVLPQTIFTTISVFFASYFAIYLALFFISLKSNLKKSYKILLLISSLSYIISSLAFAGRDGIIFSILIALTLIIYFWKSFTERIKRNFIRLSVVLLIPTIYMLYIITMDRFEDDLSTGIYGYISTQPYVFYENVAIRSSVTAYDSFYGLNLRFPIINNMLLNENTEIIRTSHYEWSFGTFLTDFYSVNGIFSFVFFSVFFTEFFRFYLKRNRRNYFLFIITYSLYLHFIISGVFYFKLGSFSGNFYLLSLMVYIMLFTKRLRNV